MCSVNALVMGVIICSKKLKEKEIVSKRNKVHQENKNFLEAT